MKTPSLSTVRAGVVGFRGYSGAELVHILRQHPHAEPILLEHRSDSIKETAPRGQRGPATLSLKPGSISNSDIDLAFLATPPEFLSN